MHGKIVRKCRRVVSGVKLITVRDERAVKYFALNGDDDPCHVKSTVLYMCVHGLSEYGS